MPRGLRIGFATPGSYSLTAANGAYALTGRDAGLTYSGDVVVAGTWQQLSFAEHSRKVIGESVAISGTFDSTYAEAVDAEAPQTVSAVPYLSFGNFVAGEPGVFYYHGSLHSNYPGNEINRIDVRTLTGTVVGVAINHQPRVSPNGPASGYDSGSGAYVFRQYGTALADTTQWQPYAHHTWTKNSWHPTWGVVMQVVGAKGDGATVGANPGGAGSAYQQGTDGQALVSYEWSEARYRLRVDSALFVAAGNYQPPGWSGASDWNQHRQSIVFLRNHGGTTYVREVVDDASSTDDLFTFDQATLSGNTWGWTDGTGGNGVLLRALENHIYLGMRADFNKFPGDSETLDRYTTIFRLRLSNTESGNAVWKLTPPAGALTGINPHGDGNISFCIARNSRRIFWVVYRNLPTVGQVQFIRFYVSTFDDPMTWTEVTTTGLPTVTHSTVEAGWLASVRQPLQFYNGYLFLIPPGQGGGANDPGYTNGALQLWRVKVDGGEELPAMQLDRLDYTTQAPGTGGFRFTYTGAPLQMIGTKHVNWAYRPSDGLYYQHAGDFGMSTCQSMCTLAFDGEARGYTFTEILDEDSDAPAGFVRPACVDDGHWFYVPTDSAFVAGRGKFVFRRGGDGEPMFFNAALQAKYSSADTNGTIAQVEAAIADGWELPSKLYLFDPDTRRFSILGPSYTLDTSACTPPSAIGATFPTDNLNGWTQDNGSTFWPDVWTQSSSACRNGTFDPVTGTLWCFYVNGGLARFDMEAKTVTMFNCSSWVSDETGRTIFLDGSSPGAFPVIADGTKEAFCYQDTGDSNRYKTYGAFHWEHKATWIDPSTGYLYVVSPGTGYLWRFDTRGTVTNTDGYRIPFAPVGKRIPVSGTYPATNSLTVWPPERWPNNDRVQMNMLLLPYKGGLLWVGANLHDSGVSGEPRYAFWRRLGYTGDWSEVTLPQEFAANAGAAREPYSADNPELLAISQAWTDNPTRQNYRYFWLITDGAQTVPLMTLAEGASHGDSNTAWNEWLLGVANAATGGKLRIIANTGLASRTIAGALASIDNQWNAADPGLAGLGSLGWVSSMIGTNDARGGAVMSAQNQTDWIAYKNKVLGYAEVMIVIAIPPVRATGGSHNVGTFNSFFEAQCAANPSRMIYVDPWNVVRDSSGNWLPAYTPSDAGTEKIHPDKEARAVVAQRAAELLGRFMRRQPLASPLVNSSADVYPTIPQTWPSPANTGTGGTNAIGTGNVPTGVTVTREGFPGSANTSIVAADAWDVNQTPWLCLDLQEVAGGTSALIVQAARSGASVTNSSPTVIDFACEVRLENVDTAAIESISARAYGVNNEELIPPNPLLLQGNGVISRRYVYRTSIRRAMSAAQAHASVTHQIRIETAAADASALGKLYIRRIGFKETA